ncbi:MAG: ATP-binding protein [Deltaproteobacteria bacterium]|jgi:SpoVK/Ycf46/Vps4 family AAA+-type ATPase|nr:ATP-binding protein [Deltaproteobacteria bacterium]MBW2383139.1 ATP-binding protein [Deltaproteobacteria bacterium]
MDDRSIQIERAQNLWSSFVRSVEPLARGAQIVADPDFGFDRIGGLAAAKDEILTYACAATNPEVYSHWGTFPPSGVLLIGAPGCGKRLLAQALARQTETAFVHVDVPRMVLDVIHGSGKVGELIQKWSQVLDEIPPLTVFFDELEFSQAHDLGGPRPDLPLGPIMDFLLELIDRTIASHNHLVIGSTGYPDTIRHAFARPGRLERVVEVTPSFPDDIIEALAIHAKLAEERSGRPLFEEIDWKRVVRQSEEAGTGDWVRILHGVLRRKARCDVTATTTEAPLVNTADLDAEVTRWNQAQRRIRFTNGGNYL